jgi:hypothetical protein
VSAAKVIDEIRHLPPGEQAEVIQFTFELARSRQLSGKELGELANRLSESDDPAEIARLKSAMTRGFYGEWAMPKVRRQNLPRPLYSHLLERVQQRKITGEQLIQLIEWLDLQPDVPAGKWFKRFSGMTVCGEADLVKTFLVQGQVPVGEEIY